MSMSFVHLLHYLPDASDNRNKNMTDYKKKTRIPSMVVNLSSSILLKTDENENIPESKKTSGLNISNSVLRQRNTVGIIGGVSVFSTLIFLEKLVWLSSKHGEEESVPFIVCSDPEINREIPSHMSSNNINPLVENLKRKRAFLENSGAKCIVMPCHFAHAWHKQVCEGSSVPFLHIGECVSVEIKEANLKPLEAASKVRIGVLATSAILKAGFYQKKLKNQGLEVVIPDKRTMEYIVNPAVEALNKKDMEGARNLLRIAIQIFLMRAVNRVILASDEMQGILPRDDPLLKQCIDPVDSMVRSTLKWARSVKSTCK